MVLTAKRWLPTHPWCSRTPSAAIKPMSHCMATMQLQQLHSMPCTRSSQLHASNSAGDYPTPGVSSTHTRPGHGCSHAFNRRSTVVRSQDPRQQHEPARESPSASSSPPPSNASSEPSVKAGSSSSPPSRAAPSANNALSPAEEDPAEAVDRQLSAVWDDLRREMKKDLDPETAQVLDTISYEELTTTNAVEFFKKIANAQLGPTLAALGLDVDPFDFFIEILQLGLFLQFITCGMVWYGSQNLLHLDTGEAVTALVGLVLGYLTRPAFKIEQLLYPVYNGLLQLFVPNAAYTVPPSSKEDVQSTLNKLSVAIACAFLSPQLLFGWDTHETCALVVPLSLAWFMFDLTYMAALLLLLRRNSID